MLIALHALLSELTIRSGTKLIVTRSAKMNMITHFQILIIYIPKRFMIPIYNTTVLYMYPRVTISIH